MCVYVTYCHAAIGFKSNNINNHQKQHQKRLVATIDSGSVRFARWATNTEASEQHAYKQTHKHMHTYIYTSTYPVKRIYNLI